MKKESGRKKIYEGFLITLYDALNVITSVFGITYLLTRFLQKKINNSWRGLNGRPPFYRHLEFLDAGQ